MGQTVLDRCDLQQGTLLQHWGRAVEHWHQQEQWRPSAKDLPLAQFGQEIDAFCRSIGMPTIGQPGRLETRHGVWFMKLAPHQLQYSDTGELLYGRWLVQCQSCSGVFATFNRHDTTCSDACQAAEEAASRAAKAEQRRQKQAAASEALANRTGVCLACGAEFPLKRITAKTCSEACRKRLQRAPELAAEHMAPSLPIRADLAALEAREQELCEEALDRIVAMLGARPSQEMEAQKAQSDQERDALAALLTHQHRNQLLNRVVELAPALGTWLLRQPEDVQAAAVGRDARTVLGPELLRKLQVA